jgi:hypothetical protein
VHGVDTSWDTCDEGQGCGADLGSAVCGVAGLFGIEGCRCDLTLFITSEHDKELNTVVFELLMNDNRKAIWEKIR